MNDWIDGLLEEILTKLDDKLGCVDLEYGSNDRAIARELLRAKLKPLLEAGEALHNDVEKMRRFLIEHGFEDTGVGSPADYAAAKAAALKEQP